MDAYISKPIRADELLQAIEGLVPVTSGPMSDGPAKVKAVAEVDFPALIARAEGDVGLARELVEMFLDDCPKMLAEIHEAIRRGDGEALERAAHTIKGAVGYFSDHRASAWALRLQEMGQNEDLTGAAETLA